MSNFKIYYPNNVIRHEDYAEFTVSYIDRLEPTTENNTIARLVGPGSLWTLYTHPAAHGLLLDRASTITAPDGTVYGFDDFPKLFLLIQNTKTERILEIL